MAEIRRFLRRLLALFRADHAEDDLAREINAHLQLLEDKFLAKGMSPDEARFAARRAFGGVEQTKEHQRDTRSFRWLDGWWLDFKLGARMLIKYPGLMLVGGLGLSVAIAIGAASFTLFYSILYPTLPLDEGERVVGLENWDTRWNDQMTRSLHDFVTWRDELKSVEDLGAFRPINRNLIVADGHADQVVGAEMTASGFRLARVPPLLGRPLIDDDERKGAPLVVVIGYDVWRTRFASDPAVVGRSVRLGRIVHTVVGVMPEGFAFPINQRLWVPLRADPMDYERREGPEINIFGRLAPGVNFDDAQAELTTIGLRTAAAFPKSHERLRPRVVPYASLLFDDVTPWELHVMQFLVSLLLVVVGANVAILVYARTATRHGEIVVRSALGASRRRIVAQLFVEALVLAAGAAAIGIVVANVSLRQVDFLFQTMGGAPFWVDYSLAPGTALYVAGLAVLAAVITGVLPALKATGLRLESGLRQLGGGTGMQLGRMWTALIVVQVALAVAVLPGAVFMAWQSLRQASVGPGFAAEEFLIARLGMDEETPPSAQAETYAREYAARYADRLAELVTRLQAEQAVSAVTVTSTEPGRENTVSIEIDASSQRERLTAARVRFALVDADFFDAFDVPILAGRGFGVGDLNPAATAVIVNRIFVQEFLGDRNPLGHRIRHRIRIASGGTDLARDAREYEIVGVVDNLPANPIVPGEAEARLYHPVARGRLYWARIAMRVRGRDAAAFAGRLREITVALDPALQLRRIHPLKEVYRQEQMGLHWGALGLALVTLSVLLLASAGIYALMSLIVTRRRREIGIRVALGADASRILRGIFSRALGQLAIGVVVGLVAAALLDVAMDGELMGGKGAVILPAVSAFMMAVGLLATLGPARRGLRIQPTEALREE